MIFFWSGGPNEIFAPGPELSLGAPGWRAVDYTVSDFTGLGIEPQALRIDSDIFNAAL